MSKHKNLRRRLSLSALTLRHRWRKSWTSWRLKRTSSRQLKAERRRQLLLLELDSHLLSMKELEQRRSSLQNRLLEMAASHQYRTQGILPPQPTDPSTQALDQVLGL